MPPATVTPGEDPGYGLLWSKSGFPVSWTASWGGTLGEWVRGLALCWIVSYFLYHWSWWTVPVVVAVIFTPPGMHPLSVAPVDLCRTSGSMRVTFAIYCVLTVCQAQHACAFHCLCCLVTKSCPALWDPMECSTPGFPVLHYLLELSQTYIYWVSDVIQSLYPLSPPSSLVLNLPRISLFQWIGCLH